MRQVMAESIKRNRRHRKTGKRRTDPPSRRQRHTDDNDGDQPLGHHLLPSKGSFVIHARRRKDCIDRKATRRELPAS